MTIDEDELYGLHCDIGRLEQEVARAYLAGYRDGSAHYELGHCPACKNIADLQEALAENARLRELVGEPCDDEHDECDRRRYLDRIHDRWKYLNRMHELGIEVI